MILEKGFAYHNKKELILNSKIAENIKAELLKKDKKTTEEVSTYFGEMNQVFEEMKRILKKGGRTCIVIGNTSLKGVEILNAEVFVEQLQNLGFKIDSIIKRKIPSKNLPSVRDKTTGRFAKASDKKKVFAYPTEYILVMHSYAENMKMGDLIKIYEMKKEKYGAQRTDIFQMYSKKLKSSTKRILQEQTMNSRGELSKKKILKN